MATTNRGLKYLEIGQKDKTITINDNMDVLDDVPMYVGEFSSDPSTTGVPHGSTYYNTGSSKLKVLKTNNSWVNVA